MRIQPKHMETLVRPDGQELPVAEGQRLVWQAMRLASQRENVYAHPWASGDLIIWDQRRTLHARVPYDAQNRDRLMWRIDFEKGAGDNPPSAKL